MKISQLIRFKTLYIIRFKINLYIFDSGYDSRHFSIFLIFFSKTFAKADYIYYIFGKYKLKKVHKSRIVYTSNFRVLVSM